MSMTSLPEPPAKLRPPEISKPFSLRKTAIVPPEAIAIASSTGGPQALFRLMPYFKNVLQPIFITQHMPPAFTGVLASHIDLGGSACVESEHGMVVKGGLTYLAPGNFHMTVRTKGSDKIIRLDQDPPENFCRPAADPMLRSLASAYGAKLLVIVLTGMGGDGLKGCQDVVKAGGTIIAQDQATSVVWGMPGAVAEAGLCHAVLPLEEIGPYAVKIAARSGR